MDDSTSEKLDLLNEQPDESLLSSIPQKKGSFLDGDLEIINNRKYERLTPWMTFVVIFGTLTGTLMGYDLASVAVTLTEITEEFDICNGQAYCMMKQFYVAIIATGALIGCVVAAATMDRFGRRFALLTQDVFFALGTILQFSAMNIDTMLAGRAFIGIGVGIGFIAFSTYISEVSPATLRGKLVTVQEVSQCFGVLLAYVFVNLLGAKKWRILLGIPGVLAVANIPMIYFLPKSPRWLLMKSLERSDDMEANENVSSRTVCTGIIKKLHGISHEAAEETVDEIVNEIMDSTVAIGRGITEKTKEVFRRIKYNWKSISMAICVGIAQDLIATNAVLYYSTDLLTSAGVCHPYLYGIGIGLMKMFDTFLVIVTVDSWGRRKLLLTGTFGTFITHILMAVIFFAIQSRREVGPIVGQVGCVDGRSVVDGLSVGFTVVLYLFVMSWDISWAGLMFVVASEILPNEVRAIGMSLAIFAFWATLMLTELTFQSLWEALTISGAFLFYAALTFIVLVFFYFLLPETKGQTLEQIAAYWHKPSQKEDEA